MYKPTSLEVLLAHSNEIPLFNDMDHGDICLLVERTLLKNINKNEVVVRELITSTDVTNIILYGSFVVSQDNNEIGELKEGDTFGVKNILYKDNLHIPQSTIQATSYKNLLLSFKIHAKYIDPCFASARLYRNMATYFSNRLQVEHQNFGSNIKKGK